MKKCTNCNKIYENDNVDFCIECGSKTVVVEETATNENAENTKQRMSIRLQLSLSRLNQNRLTKHQ